MSDGREAITAMPHRVDFRRFGRGTHGVIVTQHMTSDATRNSEFTNSSDLEAFVTIVSSN
jgi:hypothetical protein